MNDDKDSLGRYMVALMQEDMEALPIQKGHPDDAGFDLPVLYDRWVMPFSTVDVETGWRIKVPEGTWGSIKTRSSTFFHRRLLVLEAVLDPNYTGKLSVVIFNPTLLPKRIKRGERLGQLILVENPPTRFIRVYNMPKTERDSSRFGSTGR